jgi:hypothetical protein
VGCQEEKSISRSVASKRSNYADTCILLKVVFSDPFCCTFGSSPRNDTLMTSIRIGSPSNRLPYRDERHTTENQTPRSTIAHHFCLFVNVFLLQIGRRIALGGSKGELEKVHGKSARVINITQLLASLNQPKAVVSCEAVCTVYGS